MLKLSILNLVKNKRDKQIRLLRLNYPPVIFATRILGHERNTGLTSKRNSAFATADYQKR